MKTKVAALFSKLRRFRAAIVLAALAAACLFAFASGWKRMGAARLEFRQAEAAFRAASAASSSIAAQRHQAEAARLEWETAKWEYAFATDAGFFPFFLDGLCRKYGVADVTLSFLGTEAGFHKGHLRAVAYSLRMKGPFAGVYGVLSGIEFGPVPAEVKPLVLEAEGEEVRAEATVVLYSLNPPEMRLPTPGESGKADPFFSFEVRKRELKAAPSEEAAGGAREEAAESSPGKPTDSGRAAAPGEGSEGGPSASPGSEASGGGGSSPPGGAAQGKGGGA